MLPGIYEVLMLTVTISCNVTIVMISYLSHKKILLLIYITKVCVL